MSETLIETERLLLQSWEPDQLDDVIALHSDPVVAQYLTAAGTPWSAAYARDSLASWIELFNTRRLGKLRAVRKSDARFIGRAGFGIYPHTGEPELGYTFFREYWGQGYATEAAAGLRDWYFAHTDATHFIGLADIRNIASITVLKKIGMTPTHISEAEPGFTVQFLIMERGQR